MAMTQLHDDASSNAANMNKQRTIRIMVLGDEKVGKSSLISALVSQHASERVPRVLHDIVIPTEDTRDNVVISLHDTSSSSNDVMEVIKTMNRSDAAIVVYDVSRSISSQRLGYWLDLLKVTKVIPVVLVGNKSDLLPGGSEISRVQSVLRNYKFIVHSLECSARTLANVKKTFGLAQKAVLYPMAPLYDAEKKQLQPKFTTALKRTFRLFDADRDGVISRQELHEYQNVCFKTRMKPEDMDALLELVTLVKPDGVAADVRGLRFDGFAYLSELAIEKNKPEHCWQVLRTMGYSDTLELEIPLDHVDLPRDAAQLEMCELSAVALQFLKAVYDQFAPLTPAAIDDIFAIVPPPKRPTWTTLPLEHQPFLDLSAWLALWSLEVAVRPQRALEQLYYLGLVDVKASSAVEMRRSHASRRSSSNVVRCLLFGPPGCGKTLVTNSSTSFSFLSPEPLVVSFPDRDAKPVEAYQHLLHNVHTVLDKDSEKTLIITEVSEGVVDFDMVKAIATTVQVDMVCYLFDATEPDSFEYVWKLQACVADTIPCVYAYSTPTPVNDDATSLLALDKCAKHCALLKLHPPLSICLSTKAGFDGLYAALVHRALSPHGALPFTEKKAAAKKLNDRLFYGGVVAVAAVAAGVAYVYADELQELSFVKSVGRLWGQTKGMLPALKK